MSGSVICWANDAFLEALGDPALRFWIPEKVPAIMEEALQIAVNFEALDKSQYAETKAFIDPVERLRWVDRNYYY